MELTNSVFTKENLIEYLHKVKIIDNEEIYKLISLLIEALFRKEIGEQFFLILNYKYNDCIIVEDFRVSQKAVYNVLSNIFQFKFNNQSHFPQKLKKQHICLNLFHFIDDQKFKVKKIPNYYREYFSDSFKKINEYSEAINFGDPNERNYLLIVNNSIQIENKRSNLNFSYFKIDHKGFLIFFIKIF